MKRWVCLIWFDSLLAAPDHYFGKDVRTQGVIRIGAGGQPYLMPSDDIIEGPERIRIERAASSLPPLKDGEPVFVAGTFGPEDAARAPGLGVLSNAHDVVFSEYGGPDSFLPSLQLKSPKAAEDAPPKFDIAPNARR